MALTSKNIKDLNNNNVASQNVELGTLLDKIDKGQIVEELTQKEIYDLNNDNVVTKELGFGTIVAALAKDESATIQDLTLEQQKRLTNTCVAFQESNMGAFIQEQLDKTQKYKVEVTINDASMGTVQGAGRYAEHAQVTLTAVPNSGYQFVNWKKNGEIVSTNAVYTFEMGTQDISLLLTFEAMPTYTLTVNSNNTTLGTVTGSGNYVSGTSVTLTATPASNARFVNWTIDSVEIANTNPYVYTTTAEAKTIVGNFALNKLDTPTTTLDNDNLDITNVVEATGYNIYVDTVLNTNINKQSGETTVLDLNTLALTQATHSIQTSATASGYVESDLSTAVSWTPTPTPSSYNLSSNYLKLISDAAEGWWDCTTLRFTSDSSYITGLPPICQVGETANDLITAYMNNENLIIYSTGTIKGFNTSEEKSIANDTLNDIRMNEKLVSIYFDNFDTSSMTSMDYMFQGCGLLTTLDLSNFDTSNVTSMDSMFDCYALTTLNLSNFNTSNVINMREMFMSCYELVSVDISNFNINNVTNTGNMFYDCSALTTIYVSQENSNWTNKSITESEGMFSYSSALPNYSEDNDNDVTQAKLSTAGGYFTLKTI